MSLQSPIAVVGISALFPGGSAADGFWRTIVGGRDCLTDVPASHWLIEDYYDTDPEKPGKMYARRGAFLEPVAFDPLENGIPPSQLASTDTAQLLALMVARQLLDSNCGPGFRHVDRERISVILGVASATELVSTMSGSLQRPLLEKALRASGVSEEQMTAICDRVSGSYVSWTESTFPGLLGNVVAGRIANRFDLGGTNCVVDAACASSLGAIQMAMQELWSGTSDMVITGGVDAINDIFMFMCFSKTLAMSKTGDCRPFDAAADGTMLGEGLGMFALRRLEDAERDGDSIYAVLRGIGSSSDGRARSIYAPRPEGQSRALLRAYAAAGYTPATVELVEAHGTGTSAGDIAELTALRDVFGPSDSGSRQWCALGSVKSQIGHTKAAAGAASLYKTVMALHHKVLPPTIKITDPNPELQLDRSPFYLNTKTRPWVHGKEHPRRASVSAFGFGGSNFHLTLEEYCGMGARPPRILTRPSELFLISGETGASVIANARDLAGASRGDGFAEAARRSQLAFLAQATCRLAIVAREASDLSAKIDRIEAEVRGKTAFQLAAGIAWSRETPFAGKIAFLFPGQGSQYAEMGADLLMAFAEARRVWDCAARSVPDLPEIVFPVPSFSNQTRRDQQARLTATENAQPAIAITSAVYLRLLGAAGLAPDFCAGHSFGEVTALYASGVIQQEDFLAVARERGRLMAQAARLCPGAMLAVMASAEEIRPFLEGGLTLANINSPKQVVLGGSVDNIQQAERDLRIAGFAVRRLSVSTAFHSPIVAPAAEPFTAFLNGIDFREPRIPVFGNSSAAPYPVQIAQMREALGAQLALPVRFADEIEALYEAGARCFIEVGPGTVLTDLVAASLSGRPYFAVAMDSPGSDSVTAFWNALGKLAVAGIPVDTTWAWLDHRLTLRDDATPPPHAIPISGSNYGKKYPGNPETIEPAQALPIRVGQPEPQPDAASRLAAVEKIHQQMAEAHAAAQRAMSEAHLAYLRATEAAFAQLHGGSSQFAVPVTGAPAPLPIPDLTSAPAPIALRVSVPEPPQVPASPQPIENIPDLVLNIVAEKTGYPRDILALDMDLEADLGIDSIKRVQILSAVSSARPDFPEVDTRAMANLRTLGAIIDYLAPRPALVPTEIRIPQHLLVNGLARIGLRQEEAAAPAGKRTSPSLQRIAVLGSGENGLKNAIANAMQTHAGVAIVTDHISSDTEMVLFVDASSSDSSLDTRSSLAFDAARQFAATRGANGGAFVTLGSTESALSGGLAALVKTIALEYPGCIARAIEIGPVMAADEAAAAIAEEIISGPCIREVVLSGNKLRRVPEEISLPLGHDYDVTLLRGNPVIVVTGGARGITAACLCALAETAPVRFALFGRTKIEPEPPDLAKHQTETQLKEAILGAAQKGGRTISPRQLKDHARQILAGREVRDSLSRLRTLGAEAEYFTVDVTDAAVVAQALNVIREKWGRLDGVIHAAGVIEDKPIANKTPEQFDRVFRTKVVAFQNLLCATRNDNLRFIYIFTSVAGRYGNPGQADYAMANSVMTRMARGEAARRGSDCIVRALSWGPWDGGMVTDDLKSLFAARGVALIPMDRGVAAFVQELCHRGTDPLDVDVVLAAQSSAQ